MYSVKPLTAGFLVKFISFVLLLCSAEKLFWTKTSLEWSELCFCRTDGL